jgi:hypothetical protein
LALWQKRAITPTRRYLQTEITAPVKNRSLPETILVEISYIQHDAFDQSPKFLTDQTLVRSKSVLHPDAYIGHI